MEKEIKSKGPEAEASDPFADLSKLRMSQDFADEIGVEKVITKIPVGRPGNQWWVRVHKDPAYRFETAVIEVDDDGMYLVAPHLWGELADEIERVVIFTGINREGVIFFFVVKLPGSDGKWNDWHKSRFTAATIAMDHWVRVTPASGGYDVMKSTAMTDEPKWPKATFQELFRIAFKDRYINSMDHPVVKQLKGRV